jgi:hypothetical protein
MKGFHPAGHQAILSVVSGLSICNELRGENLVYFSFVWTGK